MNELLIYGRMAETHWREHRPRMVAELEAENRLRTALIDAQEQTTADMERLTRQFIKQGSTPQHAHDQAWELVREKYILLSPEPKE